MNHTQTWIGFQVETIQLRASMTSTKQIVLMNSLGKLPTGCLHTQDEIATLLGRLQWATMAFPYVKPFLQPLWAWKKAVQTSGYLGQLVQMLATLILLMSCRTLDFPSPFLRFSPWHGSSDAGANDDDATIGGWFTNQRRPQKADVYWFSLVLQPDVFPWLHDKPKL